MPTCVITWAAPPSSKAISPRPARTSKRHRPHPEARARFAAGLPHLRGGGDLWDLGLLLLNFGLEEAQAGSPVAGELLTEALRIWQQLRSRPGMALTLAGLGEVAADSGQAQPAGQLLGAARALLPATSNPLLRVTVPYDVPDRLAAARTRGDPAAFDRGLAEGQDWTIDRAVDAGLASAPRPPKTPAGSSETVDLDA
jgi:hypothetical protein